MSRTVYAVSAGTYSDYRIEALFSTRKKAERFMEKVVDSRIEEYEIDAEAVEVDRSYVVRSKYRSVEVDYVHEGWGDDDGVVQSDDEDMWVEVRARDVAHAIKIAADKFREHIALGRFDPREDA